MTDDDNPIETGDYIKASEAARLAGYSRTWIISLAKAGKVKGVQFSGWWFVSKSSLENYLSERSAAKKGTTGTEKETSEKTSDDDNDQRAVEETEETEQ